MYVSNIVSDVAVFAPRAQRGGSDLQPEADKPADRRKAGLIVNLRSFLAAHAPVQHSSSRVH
jgi:hypothetical protein